MTIDDTKLIYFPDPDKTDPDPHSYGEEGKLMPQLNKENTSQLERDISIHMHPVLWADCVTQFIGMDL